MTLGYASDELKNGREIILAVVHNDSNVYHVPDEMKNDEVNVLLALDENTFALCNASRK